MRNIKFRIWDIQAKEIVKVPQLSFGDDGLSLTISVWLKTPQGYDIVLVVGENCNLMQFTGLFDKNGKEIYEGDVVSFLSGKYEVIFKLGAFVLKSIKYPDACLGKFERTKNSQIEIIGNIYENPEIVGLKVKGID